MGYQKIYLLWSSEKRQGPKIYLDGGFKYVFVYPYLGGRFPFWFIFFRSVETTNQIQCYKYTFPETNSSPLKMGAACKRRFLLVSPPFLGAFTVSFREGSHGLNETFVVKSFEKPGPKQDSLMPYGDGASELGVWSLASQRRNFGPRKRLPETNSESCWKVTIPKGNDQILKNHPFSGANCKF